MLHMLSHSAANACKNKKMGIDLHFHLHLQLPWGKCSNLDLSFRFYQQNGATKIIAKSMFCLITATKQFCDLLIDISSQYQYVHRLGAYLSHFSAAVSLAGLSADCYYEIWKRACLNFISIYRHWSLHITYSWFDSVPIKNHCTYNGSRYNG